MKWFYDLNTAYKLSIFAILMALFMGSIGGIGYVFLEAIEKDIEELYEEAIQMKEVNELRAHARTNEALALASILSNNTNQVNAYRDEIDERLEVSNQILNGYLMEDGLSEWERETLEVIVKDLEIYKNEKEEIIRLAVAGQREEAFQNYMEIEDTIDEIYEYLSELADYNEQAAEGAYVYAMNDSNTAQATILILFISGVIITILLGWFFTRVLTKPLYTVMGEIAQIAEGDLTMSESKVQTKDEFGKIGQELTLMVTNLRQVMGEINEASLDLSASSQELYAGAEQTSEAASDVAKNTEGLSNGIEEQLSAIEVSVQSVNEMVIGIQQIAESSASVLDSAVEMNENAGTGAQSVSEVVKQMNLIQNMAEELSVIIKSLGERSKNIDDIVKVINDISAETNLLALNAAIEAARAGEHGKGFAVVADEVRKLAEQSQQSSGEITKLVQSIQDDMIKSEKTMNQVTGVITEGQAVMSTTESSFQQILGSSQGVNQQIQDVSSSTEELSTSSDQVRTSMEQVKQLVGNSADGSRTIAASSEEQLATMEEITSAADSLSKLAEKLQDGVNRFKI